MEKRLIFLIMTVIIIFLTSCKEDPNDIDPPQIPTSVSVVEPSAAETYWTDQSVPCLHNQPDYASKTTWLVGEEEDAEEVSCTDGKLDTELPDGEHKVTARISDADKSVEGSVTITVKEGFSVELVSPDDGTKLFAESEITCEAKVTPEKYSEHLRVVVDGVGEDCTKGSVTLPEAGQTGITASVSIDGREESSAVTLDVLPKVVVRVYPLTASGVATSVGTGVFLNLPADKVAKALQTTATTAEQQPAGTFEFTNVPTDIYERERVILKASAGSDFYQSHAEITGPELLEIVQADSLGFVLAPKRWEIQCGPLAGQSTSIKLPEAFTRYDPDRQFSSFYMLTNVVGKLMYRGLRPQDRPLPAAFNHAESEVLITAADSTSFWTENEKIEEKICRGSLLTPSTMADVPTIDDGLQIRALSVDGRASGGAITDDFGHITGGTMNLPIDDFGPSYGQRHETTQVLGFGETSHWVGVMSGNAVFHGDDVDLTKHSVDDISHIQLYMDTTDLQHEEGIAFGVYEWRRVFDIPSLPDN